MSSIIPTCALILIFLTKYFSIIVALGNNLLMVVLAFLVAASSGVSFSFNSLCDDLCDTKRLNLSAALAIVMALVKALLVPPLDTLSSLPCIRSVS